MITLIINKPGHYIEIPGISPFRTPASVNISNLSIPLVVSILNTQGITKFEIVSNTKGKGQTLTQNDFVVLNKNPKKQQDNYEKRFNKLEELMSKLLQNQTSNTPSNKEQITNRLNTIEKQLKNADKKVIRVTKSESKPVKQKEVKVEELYDTFIPEIDLKGLELKGAVSQKTIEQDKSDIDDNADLLSRIMGSED